MSLIIRNSNRLKGFNQKAYNGKCNLSHTWDYFYLTGFEFDPAYLATFEQPDCELLTVISSSLEEPSFSCHAQCEVSKQNSNHGNTAPTPAAVEKISLQSRQLFINSNDIKCAKISDLCNTRPN